MLKRLFSFIFIALFSARLLAAEPFKDGDRWVVIGDSITHWGTYHAWVYLYYATRFPDRKLEVWNAGISGDSTPGTLGRYDWDIKPRNASVATVMLGMNDVYRDLYTETAPSAENLAKRASAIRNFKNNITALAQRLQSDHVRMILMTPTPFDDTVDLPSPRQTGINDALKQCGDIVKTLAPQVGASVIDIHTPMTELDLRLQAADPKATVVGADRVHPGAAGHFAMAYWILKEQGMPSLVSHLEIDAAARKVIRVENGTVEPFSASGNELRFTYTEKALPYPVPAEVRPALDWIPFQDELNRETLRVANLRSETYTLWIDDQQIGVYSKLQLENGLNLAEMNTPQARQSADVLALVKKWQVRSALGDRGIAEIERSLLKDLPHPVSFEDAKPVVEAKLSTLDPQNKKDAYSISIYERYLAMKPKEAQTQQELSDFAFKIHDAAKPKPHIFRIVPLH